MVRENKQMLDLGSLRPEKQKSNAYSYIHMGWCAWPACLPTLPCLPKPPSLLAPACLACLLPCRLPFLLLYLWYLSRPPCYTSKTNRRQRICYVVGNHFKIIKDLVCNYFDVHSMHARMHACTHLCMCIRVKNTAYTTYVATRCLNTKGENTTYTKMCHARK